MAAWLRQNFVAGELEQPLVVDEESNEIIIDAMPELAMSVMALHLEDLMNLGQNINFLHDLYSKSVISCTFHRSCTRNQDDSIKEKPIFSTPSRFDTGIWQETEATLGALVKEVAKWSKKGYRYESTTGDVDKELTEELRGVTGYIHTGSQSGSFDAFGRHLFIKKDVEGNPLSSVIIGIESKHQQISEERPNSLKYESIKMDIDVYRQFEQTNLDVVTKKLDMESTRTVLMADSHIFNAEDRPELSADNGKAFIETALKDLADKGDVGTDGKAFKPLKSGENKGKKSKNQAAADKANRPDNLRHAICKIVNDLMEGTWADSRTHDPETFKIVFDSLVEGKAIYSPDQADIVQEVQDKLMNEYWWYGKGYTPMVSLEQIKQILDSVSENIKGHYGVYYDGDQRKFGLTYTKTSMPYVDSGDGLRIKDIPLALRMRSNIYQTGEYLKGTWALGYKIENGEIIHRLFKLEYQEDRNVFAFISKQDMEDGWVMGYKEKRVLLDGTVEFTTLPQAIMVLEGKRLEGRIAFDGGLMDRNKNPDTNEIDHSWTSDEYLYESKFTMDSQGRVNGLDIIGITTHSFGAENTLIYSHHDLTNSYLRHEIVNIPSKRWSGKYYGQKKSDTGGFISPEYEDYNSLEPLKKEKIDTIRDLLWTFEGLKSATEGVKIISPFLQSKVDSLAEIMGVLGADEDCINQLSSSGVSSKKEVLFILYNLISDCNVPIDPSDRTPIQDKIHNAQIRLGSLPQFESTGGNLENADSYKDEEIILAKELEENILKDLFGYESLLMVIFKMVSFDISAKGSISATPIAYFNNLLLKVLKQRGLKGINAYIKDRPFSIERFPRTDILKEFILTIFGFGYISQYRSHGSTDVEIAHIINNKGYKTYVDEISKNEPSTPSNVEYFHSRYGEIVRGWISEYYKDSEVEKIKSDSLIKSSIALLEEVWAFLGAKYEKSVRANSRLLLDRISNKEILPGQEEEYIQGLIELFTEFAYDKIEEAIWNEPAGGDSDKGRFLTMLTRAWSVLTGRPVKEISTNRIYSVVGDRVDDTFWSPPNKDGSGGVGAGEIKDFSQIVDKISQFYILLKYTYDNVKVKKNYDRKFNEAENRIIQKLLNHNQDIYKHQVAKVMQLINEYFGPGGGAKDILQFDFLKGTHFGFSVDTHVTGSGSNLENDVLALFEGRKIKVEKKDLGTPELERKVISIVFFQMLAKLNVFVSDGYGRWGTLVACLGPNGKLRGNQHLICLLPKNVRGDPTLQNTYSQLSSFGQTFYENNKDTWNKNENGQDVIVPGKNPALVSFVSTPIPKGSRRIPRAERGGYDHLAYKLEDPKKKGSLRYLFSSLFGYKEDIILELI